MPLCGWSTGYPCYDDTAGEVRYDSTTVPVGATVYEDGSWEYEDGTSGCIEGRECDDDYKYPVCEDEYESTNCIYIQDGKTWYVDKYGEVHGG